MNLELLRNDFEIKVWVYAPEEMVDRVVALLRRVVPRRFEEDFGFWSVDIDHQEEFNQFLDELQAEFPYSEVEWLKDVRRCSRLQECEEQVFEQIARRDDRVRWIRESDRRLNEMAETRKATRAATSAKQFSAATVTDFPTYKKRKDAEILQQKLGRLKQEYLDARHILTGFLSPEQADFQYINIAALAPGICKESSGAADFSTDSRRNNS